MKNHTESEQRETVLGVLRLLPVFRNGGGHLVRVSSVFRQTVPNLGLLTCIRQRLVVGTASFR